MKNNKAIDMSVDICGLTWQNPITTASGTFSARDSLEFYDWTKLGAITTKGVSLEPWEGNPTPRIAETYGGMLNSVGLENKGVYDYVENELPFIKKKIKEAESKTLVIANLAGHTEWEYKKAAMVLNDSDVDMIELNISCPNIDRGGIGFGSDPRLAFDTVQAIKGVINKPLIVKLSPNVTDITQIAKMVEDAGADAISLINTLLGMSIDIKSQRPHLSNTTGGLSGPAIKPIAVRMVYEVSQTVDIPIIGMGGISNANDVIEFMMAGASAVAVGTAALVNPTAPLDILDELENYGR